MCGRSASRERFEGRGGVKRRRTFGALGAAFANALRQVIDDEAEHRKRNAAVKRDALIRIEAHADHDGDAEDRPHDGHEGEPGALVLELGEIMPFGKELLAEAVVRNRNAQPHGDRREAHDRGEDHEDRVGRHDARTESEEPAEGGGITIEPTVEKDKKPDTDKKTCPQCGAPVSEDALFCNKCGAQL